MNYTIHPIADLFPMLDKPQLDELANDIRDNGLFNPIIVQGDTLIDGRNRMEACRIAKVKPEFKEFTGDDPVAFIIGQNIHRRHLDESQRAMLAARIANMEVGKPNCSNLSNKTSQSKAAEMLNVSRTSVQAAKSIADASPDLADQVMRGEITVHAAKQQIKQTETKTETTKEVSTKGSFEDWRSLKKIADEVCERIAIIEGLRVDAQHVIQARDLCQSLSEKFQKLTRKIVG